MYEFVMNGYLWHILFVPSYSDELIDRNGNRTLACTDPDTKLIFVDKSITGKMYERVITHELAHCAIVSFNLLDDIHRFVKKEYWVYAEEWVCNFLADYGPIIQEIESVLYIHF